MPALASAQSLPDSMGTCCCPPSETYEPLTGLDNADPPAVESTPADVLQRVRQAPEPWAAAVAAADQAACTARADVLRALFAAHLAHPYAYSPKPFTDAAARGDVTIVQCYLEALGTAEDQHFALVRMRAAVLAAAAYGHTQLVQLMLTEVCRRLGPPAASVFAESVAAAALAPHRDLIRAGAPQRPGSCYPDRQLSDDG